MPEAFYHRIHIKQLLRRFHLTARKELRSKLEYRGELLQIVTDISGNLLTAELEDYAETLQRAFATIGQAARVDRVYLWKNSRRPDGTLCMKKLYDWSTQNAPWQDSSPTGCIPYDEFFPSCKETLLLGQCLNSLVKDLGETERRQLGAQGIVSLLIAPLFVQDKFWGFIGFDDCHHERVFSKIEENVLRTCGYMVMVSSDIVQNEIATNLITAREEALETAHMKSRFLANMSHEIRTPMNAILGMVELILHEDISDAVRSHAADIKGASRGLLAIINDILDISKIEAGKLEIASTRYDISSLLLDVVSIVKMRADRKRLPFLVNIDPALPCALIGDEVRVKQVLINLLSNAVKFTHTGHVTLSVRGRVQGEALLLECEVRDTGIGLREEDMERLFESFQQFDTKKNRNIEGTGLGLSISKQLAERMGGSITVQSRYGTGSTFTAYLTQRIANPQPIATLKDPARGGVIVYGSGGVCHTSIICALESLNCRYQSCESPFVLRELLEAGPVDFLFASSAHADKLRAIAREYQITLVALEEGGNPPPEGLLSLSMPIHSLQLANILNGNHGENRAENSADRAGLAAPAARVLVVDDNLVNLKVAAGLLKTFAITADTATSALQAISILGEKDYDLVFMDHMMPEMDGVEAVRFLRAMEGGRLATLPVIALTANAVSGMREMFLENGFSDYLAKPVEMLRLSELLGKWLPAEKCVFLRAEPETPEPFVPQSAPLEIEGLDTARGLLMTGGAQERYREVLSLYCRDAAARLPALSGEAEGLSLLTTHIHALKSASASIGASGLAEEAARLEAAGLRGDRAFLQAALPGFCGALAALMARIEEALRLSQTAPAQESADLSAELTLLAQALRLEDIKSINECMERLARKSFDGAGRALFDELSDCVLLSDFQEALARIDDLLRKGVTPR